LACMSEGRLKTAVLGLTEQGQQLLKAASETDYFHIEAVADSDTKLAEKIAAEYECTANDDYRQLVIQNQLDCLLVAAGMHSCEEHLRAAIKKKFNILKLAPVARNFEEAAGFVQLAEEQGVQFAIANPTRFADSFLALHTHLEQGKIEQVFLITVVCDVGDRTRPAWHNDPQLAGGGVLLYDCYDIIDQILWNFPIPQQVYSLSSNQALDKQQRLYLTEDTAIIAMKFDDALIGNLTASRRNRSTPAEEYLRIFGKECVLTVSNTEFTISDGLGQTRERQQYEDDTPACMKKVLENFALSILSPEENKLSSSARENLKNMAVIEAAYLSARTGFPEEPKRILQMVSSGAATPTNM